MNKIFACIAVSVMCMLTAANVCFARTVNGPGGDIEIEFPEELYTMYYGDKENNEISNQFDISYESLKESMSENNIYADGITEDSGIEIMLRITENDNSYGEPSDYSQKQIETYVTGNIARLEAQSAANVTAEMYDNNFVKASYEAEGKNWIEYSTFRNKHSYSVIACYTYAKDKADAEAYIDSVRSSLVLPEAKSSFLSPGKWKQLQWMLIIIFITVAGNLLLSLITRYVILRRPMGSKTAFIAGLLFAAAVFVITCLSANRSGVKINPGYGNVFFIWLNWSTLSRADKSPEQGTSDNQDIQ